MLFVDDVVKMKAALVLLASFATLALTGVVVSCSRAHSCPDDWVLFGDSCYAFLDDVVPWVTAQAYCRQLNSKILEVDSKAENDFIVAQIRSRTGIDYVWNGINDLVREGKWVLNSNNQQPPYLNWRTGEPNNLTGEDCVEISGTDGKWNDILCEHYRPANGPRVTPVCEREAKRKSLSLWLK